MEASDKRKSAAAPKRTIICGTDFSLHAAEAANVAAALATRNGDDLILVHVEPDRPGARKPNRRSETIQRSVLAREAARLRHGKLNVFEELLTGSPYEELIKLGVETKARLIVLSSVGRAAASQWFVGTVAERVAETSPIPVMVVRQSDRITNWAASKQPLKAVVGMDMSSSAQAALQWVADFSEKGNVQATLAHISWPPEDWRRLGYGPDDSRMAEESWRRELKGRATAAGLKEAQVIVEPSWGRADDRVLEIAEKVQADLIVVGTHQKQGISRYWLGSVSRGLLHHASTNLVVVPPPTEQPSAAVIPKISEVLVATDFSEIGNSAIAHAFSLPQPGGAVHLVHVLPPHHFPGPTVPHYQRKPTTPREQVKKIKAAEASLQALIPAAAAARDISSQVEVLESDNPAEAICQCAERICADTICIGSHGRSRIFTALLGSVAQAVMACSKRPVLVIRPRHT